MFYDCHILKLCKFDCFHEFNWICELLTFLGTRSKVLMLVHISPRDEDVGETICSLSFTKRARAIESNRGLTDVSTCTAVYAFISVSLIAESSHRYCLGTSKTKRKENIRT